MRKIIIIMLVAMVPFLTMAQKRSKKKKDTNTETVVEFLVVKGIEYSKERKSPDTMDEKVLLYANLKRLQKMDVLVSYDFGRVESQENTDLIAQSERFRTMADAVNAATAKGWEFQSATTTSLGDVIMHYYYMTRYK